MSTPEETYRRGSVVLRGDQIPRLTADASLLQTEHSSDWKHTDPWRVLRIQSEFVEGFEALSEVRGPGHRAAARAEHEPVGKPRRELPLLLCPQDHVRQVLPGLYRHAGRFWHDG